MYISINILNITIWKYSLLIQLSGLSEMFSIFCCSSSVWFISLCMFCHFNIFYIWFILAQMVKNLPAMQETWVQYLSQEDPLETGMATHSSILAWEIPWTEVPGRLHTVHAIAELNTTEQLTLSYLISDIYVKMIALFWDLEWY